MTQHPTQAVYVISVFAEIAGVHPQTMRNYERTGLLSPQRTAGGSRRFSEADLAVLRRIQELTTEGINRHMRPTQFLHHRNRIHF